MEVSFNKKTGFLVKQKKSTVNLNEQVVAVSQPDGQMLTISGPGEYEVGGVAVTSQSYLDKTIFLIEFEEMRLAYLGDMKDKLTETQLDWLDGVDVFLANGQSAELIKQVRPSLVVSPTAIDGFTGPVRNEAKLTINKLDLPEETEAVIING